MYAKVRKMRGGGIKLTARLPINAMSRNAVDAETERFRHSVIPIIRDKDGRPFLEGSAVAISFYGQKCLATAFHVLKDNEGRPLFYFGSDGRAKIFGGDFEISNSHDIAVVRLDLSDEAALSNIPFITEERLGSAANADGAFYASVAGYPHTTSKLKDRHTLDTPMEVYSNKATEREDGFLSVQFHKKQGVWTTAGHGRARDPIGKSGGAIFGMPLLGLNGVVPDAKLKLVGIPTHWRGKEIIGASVGQLTPLLEAVTSP